jgi:hypothetical protein
VFAQLCVHFGSFFIAELRYDGGQKLTLLHCQNMSTLAEQPVEVQRKMQETMH